MSAQLTCPVCGQLLPEDAPKGLCPKCLLANLVNVGSSVADTAGSTILDPEAANDNPSPEIGSKIRYFGDYELLEEIARGGMGVVYRARQVSLNRMVALKMILAGQLATEAEVQRFHLEAEAAAKLDHPNIVPIHEVGRHEGRHYFSMKLIEGESLAGAMRSASLPQRKAVSIIATLARAVHYAHQRGILHRDLKPGNILIDKDGTPYLTDFGLAKFAEKNTSLTQSMAVIGSANYMSPEQASGHARELTTAADIYSLGAVLYECLTGMPPFSARTFIETLRQVTEAEPKRPESINRAVDRDLSVICLKCLEKQPQRRYRSAETLADDLENWLSNRPITARPVSAVERFLKWAQRRPAIATLSFSVVLLALSLVAGSFVAVFRITNALNAAQAEAAKSKEVAQFLKAMLEGVDPSEARGRNMTILREILDRAAERVTSDLKKQPDVEAELLTAIGDVYRRIGEYEKAERMLRDSLRIRTNLFGFTNAQVAEVLGNLGVTILESRNLPESEKINRQALELRRAVFGNEHTDVALSLNDLANTLYYKGDFTGAERLHRKAYAMRKKLLSADHLDTGKSLNNLAIIVNDRGDTIEAETMFEETLRVFRKHLGQEGPLIATVLYNLAFTAAKNGDLKKAELLNRETVAMRKKFLSENHAEVSNALNQLALTLAARGDLIAAESTAREAMENKLLGPDHPHLGDSHAALGIVFSKRGDLAGAEREFIQTISIRSKQLSPGHPDVAECLVQLGIVAAARRDFTRAGGLFSEALEIYEKVPGAPHPGQIAVHWGLHWIARESGDKIRAQDLASRAFTMAANNGPNGIRILTDAMFYAADLLSTQGLFADAESLLLDAFKAQPQNSVRGRARLQETVDRIINFYEVRGDSAKAAQWNATLTARSAPENVLHK